MKIPLYLFASLLSVTAVFSQKTVIVANDMEGWHKIAQVRIREKEQQLEVSVLGASRFTDVKFRRSDTSIQLKNTTVFYEEGDSATFAVKIPRDTTESLPISLDKGKAKKLKRIAMQYSATAHEAEIPRKIEVWGKK